MSGHEFSPREIVAGMGERSLALVEQIAAGKSWTPATLRAASERMAAAHAPRLAKKLHLLAAIWAVNHPGARA